MKHERHAIARERAVEVTMEPTPASLNGNAEILFQALRKVLAPLVRMMLAHSIGYRQAAGLLKQVYVDVARRELERTGDDASASRLSLFTGIHRKEIKRLSENPPDALEVPLSVALGVQAVARWTSDARFLHEDGKPRALRRTADESRAPGFDQLITSITTDVHPRSVLDEWLRLGIVEFDAEDRIQLVTAAFVPQKGFDEKAFFFERNLHDHLEVAARNLAGGEPPLLERSVSYASLPRHAIDELEEMARRQGMQLLEAVNERARAHQQDTEAGADETTQAARGRMNFGLYFCREDAVDAPPDAPSTSTATTSPPSTTPRTTSPESD